MVTYIDKVCTVISCFKYNYFNVFYVKKMPIENIILIMFVPIFVAYRLSKINLDLNELNCYNEM